MNQHLLTLASRADVAGCASQDIPPRFPLTQDFDSFSNNGAFYRITSEENIPPKLIPSLAALELTSRLRTKFPKHSEIFDLFDDVANHVARLKFKLLDSERNVYKNTIWACVNLHSLTHWLLSHRVSVDPDDFGSVIQEVIRLGLLLFFTQVRRYFKVPPDIVVDVCIEKLVPLLETKMDWGEFNIFKFWATALGATQAKSEEKTVLVEMMRELLALMGIGSHAKAEGDLRELLWIGEIHGIAFWELLYREIWIVVA